MQARQISHGVLQPAIQAAATGTISPKWPCQTAAISVWPVQYRWAILCGNAQKDCHTPGARVLATALFISGLQHGRDCWLTPQESQRGPPVLAGRCFCVRYPVNLCRVHPTQSVDRMRNTICRRSQGNHCNDCQRRLGKQQAALHLLIPTPVGQRSDANADGIRIEYQAAAGLARGRPKQHCARTGTNSLNLIGWVP